MLCIKSFPKSPPSLLKFFWIRVTRSWEERVLKRLACVGKMLPWDSYVLIGDGSSKSSGDNGGRGTIVDWQSVALNWSSFSKFIWLIKESSLISKELSFLLSLLVHFSKMMGCSYFRDFSGLSLSWFRLLTLRRSRGELVATGKQFSSLPCKPSHLLILSTLGEQSSLPLLWVLCMSFILTHL